MILHCSILIELDITLYFRPMTSMQGDFRSMHVRNESFLKYLTIIWLHQGSSNLSLEGQSAAEFNASPDQTHLPVIFLMILKTLISMLRCVWLGLELNSAGMVQIWGSLDYTVRHCYVLSRKDPSCEFVAYKSFIFVYLKILKVYIRKIIYSSGNFIKIICNKGLTNQPIKKTKKQKQTNK